LNFTIETSEDRGVHWTSADANLMKEPSKGTWMRFPAGGNVLNSIYDLICQGILDTEEIGRRVGYPQWVVDDLLLDVSPDDSDGDYLRLSDEYKAARRVGAFLRNANAVLDLSGSEEAA
jgi:hypothetical protein